MKSIASEEVVMVRIYLAASMERRELLFRRLQQWERLRGATVLQAVEGFGSNGVARDDVAPSIIEFFDTREEVDRVIEDLAPLVEHIVTWPAQASVVK